MTDTSMVPSKRDGDRPASPPLIDEQLADQLLGKAQAEAWSCRGGPERERGEVVGIRAEHGSHRRT